MLDAVAKLARRRALIVVISDFIGDGDWGRSLLRLVPRHEVVALRVIDAADDELPDVGLVVEEMFRQADVQEQILHPLAKRYVVINFSQELPNRAMTLLDQITHPERSPGTARHAKPSD